MNVIKYLRLLFFVLPLGFGSLSIIYNDLSYLFLAGITLFVACIIAIPKLFVSKNLSFKFNKHIVTNKVLRSNFKNKKTKQIDSLDFKNKIIYPIITTIIFVIFFTYIGSQILRTITSIHNPILEYYYSQILSLKQTWISLLFLSVLIAITFSSLKFSALHKKVSYRFNRPQFINKLLISLTTVVVGFVISLPALYLYAIIQLNTAAIAFNAAPSTVGVIFGKNAINNKLKSMTNPPQVIGSDKNLSNTILSIIVNGNSNQSSFYSVRIINTIPHFLLIPFKIGNQPVYLVHTTLIINNIDKDTMQIISPALAHLFLQNYFKNHVWKNDPNIIILSRQDYLSFRQSEIDNQVQQLNNQIQKIEGYIGQVQSDIYLSNQKIAANQSALQQAQSYKSTTYSNCVNAGYYDYYFGTFYHYYTQSYCEGLASQYDQYITGDQQNISDWNSRLQTDESYLNDAQNVEQEYKNAVDYVNSQKDSTPDELGKFNEPNTVRVVLDSTSPKGINEFLETLIHENLHYQSSIKDRNFQFSDGSYDGFWEEGLTEYFARKVIIAGLGVNVNQGYPLLVNIVSQIAKKIPESTLQQVYFDKDDTTLQAMLNTAYGNTFYKDTEPYFEYLSYLPDNLQLKYANNIVTRIGGIKLTSNDLYSTDLQQQ